MPQTKNTRCNNCHDLTSGSDTCWLCRARELLRPSKLYTGCTPRRFKALGIHAVINARSGETWRNGNSFAYGWDSVQEVEMMRDMLWARSQAPASYRPSSKWFRKHFNNNEVQA